MAIRPVRTPSRSASAAVGSSARSRCRRQAGRCAASRPPVPGTPPVRRPDLCAVTASSMATRPDWSRRALAPGVRMRPAGPRAGIVPLCSTTARGLRDARVTRCARTIRRGGRRAWPRWPGLWVRPRRLGGTAWMVEAGDRTLVAKVGHGARDEAEGLRALAAVPSAPSGARASSWRTRTSWSPPRSSRLPGRPRHEEALGRDLAHLHARPYDTWGGGSSLIGACPVEPALCPMASTFYAVRLLGLAERCGLSRRAEPGGGPAGRAASPGRTRAGARRPLVGQRPLGCRRAGLAHRPVGPRGPPRRGPGHARPVRHRSRARAARLRRGAPAGRRLGGPGRPVPARPPARAHRALRRRLPGPGRGGGPALRARRGRARGTPPRARAS